MAKTWTERFKSAGNTAVKAAIGVLVVQLMALIGSGVGVVWLALRGNPHGPWFYAIAGALIASLPNVVFSILFVILLVRQRSAIALPSTDRQETEWLYGKAREHGERMFRVVSVTGVDILPTGINRTTDPYFDVTVSLWNHSIFDVELVDLTGRFYLNTWEFRRPVHWLQTPHVRLVPSDGIAQFTFRQNLIAEDVEYIRLNRAQFGFNNLNLMVQGLGTSASFVTLQPLVWSASPTNRPLYVALGGTWQETA